MGIYLFLMAVVDIYYRGNYAVHDRQWRQSKLCAFAGFLSTFSGELSVLTLTVITVDRFFAIVFPFQVQKLNRKNVKLVLLCLWSLALVLYLIPFLDSSYFGSFYGHSEMCLPIPIASERHARLVVSWNDGADVGGIVIPESHQSLSRLQDGWEYSVFVFIIINGVSFLIICVLYIWMYISEKKRSKSSTCAKSVQQKRDWSLARRMTLIVGTDALCWLPVIGLGIYCLQGNTIHSRVSPAILLYNFPLKPEDR